MMTETALLGVLWILSVHFHKQREDLLTNNKRKKEKRKETAQSFYSYLERASCNLPSNSEEGNGCAVHIFTFVVCIT